MRKIGLLTAIAASAAGLIMGSGVASAADASVANGSPSSIERMGISPGCDGGLLTKPDVTNMYYDHYYGDSRLTACQMCDGAANLLADTFGWKYTWCAEFGNNEIAELWYGSGDIGKLHKYDGKMTLDK
ncbi:hypothetical protein [Amycolatopsis sp. cmx-4-54]|uniref:hypothetical protein n=1 Tax=Amycolatopsis sp. cmx-4-54 TaxID=2790936 RepID=UPI00397D5354